MGENVGQGLAGPALPADGFANQALAGAAKAIAGGDTRSLITGQDFGSSVIAELPNIIGNAIGGDIAGAIQQKIEYDNELEHPTPKLRRIRRGRDSWRIPRT
ncbi:MAG: hypothetical protein ACHP84_01090 [Caulobacterales bacterium]